MANSIVRELTRFLDRSTVDELTKDLGLRRRSGISSAFATFGLFAAGVIAGAAVSLLLAPKSGEEMRGDIAQRWSSWRENMEEKVQSVARKGERHNPPS
jgi:hypothetical protein